MISVLFGIAVPGRQPLASINLTGCFVLIKNFKNMFLEGGGLVVNTARYSQNENETKSSSSAVLLTN